MLLRPARQRAPIDADETPNGLIRGIGKPFLQVSDDEASVVREPDDVFIESVPNHVANPLDSDQELIDDVKVV